MTKQTLLVLATIFAISCQAPKGEIGPKGPIGQTGQAGLNGTNGPTGEKGPIGDKGATGPQGNIGPAGANNTKASGWKELSNWQIIATEKDTQGNITNRILTVEISDALLNFDTVNSGLTFHYLRISPSQNSFRYFSLNQSVIIDYSKFFGCDFEYIKKSNGKHMYRFIMKNYTLSNEETLKILNDAKWAIQTYIIETPIN